METLNLQLTFFKFLFERDNIVSTMSVKSKANGDNSYDHELTRLRVMHSSDFFCAKS